MNDQTIEQEIQAKGLTAPRITPADIEANIASAHYFTADEGVIGGRWYAAESDDQTLDLDDDIPQPLQLLTFCVLVLRNGFTVTGESACASPENFDVEIGRNIARQNAVQKIWPLMGYQLRDELHRRAVFAAEPKTGDQAHLQQHIDMVRESGWAPAEVIPSAAIAPAILPSALQPHQQRVVDEKRDLDEKRAKLIAFFATPTFAALPADERARLEAQEHFMGGYANVLADRIAHF